jgi:putative membrane protein
MNAERFLTESERRAVADAVADAEKSTAAEFVCAVATESGRYDRAESIVGVIGALVALTAAYWAAAWTPRGSWSLAGTVGLTEAAAAIVVGFVVGSVLASILPSARRPFVGRREMDAEVARAADHVFAARRLTTTRERGGVLLYVSLFERRVLVLADSGAMKALGDEGVIALRDLAVQRLRSGHRLQTFTDAVAAAAERLSGSLPPSAENADELPNALLVFHPRP